MSAPHDRPTAAELIEAVEEMLRARVERTDRPSPRFDDRVAANALRIARAEILSSADHERRHAMRLSVLGMADDAELCDAIRNGRLDDRWGEVVAAVRDSVIDKLDVASPGYNEIRP